MARTMSSTFYRALLPCLCSLLLCSSTRLPAQTPGETAEAVLGQLRAATGGDAWDRVAELRTQGTVHAGGRLGSILIIEDLQTGGNVDLVELQGVGRVEHHADLPGENWEQAADDAVVLSPGSRLPEDIDDLYIHGRGWWRPHFGGASITLLPAATEGAALYDRLQCQVPGGKGFTLWINRATHTLDRIASGGSTTFFSDHRSIPSGLIVPFHQQKGTGDGAVTILTTSLTALPTVQPADFAPPFQTDYTFPASGKVEVPTQADGVTFDVTLDGHGPFPAIFDTGAVNLMNLDLARRLGLPVDKGSDSFSALGGSGKISVQKTHVSSLRIGALTLRNQDFVVVDLPASTGTPELLLGWQLMRRFAVRMDFQNRRLTFFDGRSFTPDASMGSAVPLQLNPHGNGFFAKATVAGFPGTFLIDSGNQGKLGLEPSFVQRHGLVAALHARLRGYDGKGLAGDSPEAWIVRSPEVRIGGFSVPDAIVRLQTGADTFTGTDGNIGQSILRRFTVTLDCMRSTMYLKKNSFFEEREIFNRAGLILDWDQGADAIKTVLPGSPAERAGLLAGDRITGIDGHPPADDPNDPVFNQTPGTVLHLTATRSGATHTYAVTLRDVL